MIVLEGSYCARTVMTLLEGSYCARRIIIVLNHRRYTLKKHLFFPKMQFAIALVTKKSPRVNRGSIQFPLKTIRLPQTPPKTAASRTDGHGPSSTVMMLLAQL